MHTSRTHPFRIHTEPQDSVLREESQEIALKEINTPEMQQLYDNLIAAMIDFDGIGIAAPQVGLPSRIFVVDRSYVDDEYHIDDDHLVLINPRMVSTSSRTTSQDEGCLSVPGVYGTIARSAKVRMKAYRRDGVQIDIKAKGMFARILQHEYDHLEGTLFIDSATNLHTYDADKQ